MRMIIEDTIDQYERLFSTQHNKEHFFRHTMMKPFEKMWNMINVPLKAKQQNGYDVIMATKMLGYLDVTDTQTGQQALKRLQEIQALQTADITLNHCMDFIEKHNLQINADELRFGLYLGDPKKLELQKGYCGFGGILDLFKYHYIQLHIISQEFLLSLHMNSTIISVFHILNGIMET